MTQRTPEGDHLKRCAICGFVVDTSYEATKPTIDFTMRGRGKKGDGALGAALDELERVTALWREAELTSKDFQMTLGRLCYRYGRDLSIDRHVDQARDLLRRKGTLSPLRVADGGIATKERQDD
jgi:hypothetical protein